jgi:nitrate reductase gamma subunit
MNQLLAAIAYTVYAAFGLRLLWHFFTWIRASAAVGAYAPKYKTSFGTRILMALDIVFFRRLLVANGLLWTASWTFHLSFFIVVVRHLRFFIEPVPACVRESQTCGLIAGYILPASVLCLLLIRTVSAGERYLTKDNYLILLLTLGIATTGLLLRTVFRADLVGIKGFTHGLLTFQPGMGQNSYLFVVHFSLALLLILILPSHIFSAPLVTIEARRREQALNMVMHHD